MAIVWGCLWGWCGDVWAWVCTLTCGTQITLIYPVLYESYKRIHGHTYELLSWRKTFFQTFRSNSNVSKPAAKKHLGYEYWHKVINPRTTKWATRMQWSCGFSLQLRLRQRRVYTRFFSQFIGWKFIQTVPISEVCSYMVFCYPINYFECLKTDSQGSRVHKTLAHAPRNNW